MNNIISFLLKVSFHSFLQKEVSKSVITFINLSKKIEENKNFFLSKDHQNMIKSENNIFVTNLKRYLVYGIFTSKEVCCQCSTWSCQHFPICRISLWGNQCCSRDQNELLKSFLLMYAHQESFLSPPMRFSSEDIG